MEDLGKKTCVDDEEENNVRKAPGAQGQQGRSSSALNVITERNKTPGFGRIWELLAAVQTQERLVGQMWGLSGLLGEAKMAKNQCDAHGPL